MNKVIWLIEKDSFSIRCVPKKLCLANACSRYLSDKVHSIFYSTQEIKPHRQSSPWIDTSKTAVYRAEVSVSRFFWFWLQFCSWNLVLIPDPRLLLCMLCTSFWFWVLEYLEHDSDSGYEIRLKLRISLLFKYFHLKRLPYRVKEDLFD